MYGDLEETIRSIWGQGVKIKKRQPVSGGDINESYHLLLSNGEEAFLKLNRKATDNFFTAEAHGLRYVSLRYFNACGADESSIIGEAHNPESHLIPLILQVPNGKRETISIYGTDYDTPDGTCIRDYIHVTDLAQAHILAVQYLNNGGKSDIFNLGNGVGYSVREVIETARKVTGHPIPATETSRRAGDPARLVASSEKAKSVLGWKPVHDSLEEIIASAWNWHKNHPNGYDE